MSRIYWDTMLFVYWIEEHPAHATQVRRIFEKMEKRGDTLCTSVLTLGELLVGPKKQRSVSMADRIRHFFGTPAVDLLPFTPATAEHYADIRAANRITPADAVHLASAASAGVDLFLTNDRRLRGLVIPGIHFIAGMDSDIL